MDLQGQYVPRPPNDFLSRQEKFTWRGESRWRNTAGNRIYTYDQLHGHVEVYNRRGRHLGVLDVMSGEGIGDAVKGRRIDV
ncbi:colicin E3/pyocin S6 family cytotoxin [Mycolicibacterium sp. P1-18]|uniref:colicin E3/pyocin S6 family cytotoxin n=1 Tax=Mycolicibacterium sp. P1-18 TaxID=2024615 RepID=UPI0018D81870